MTSADQPRPAFHDTSEDCAICLARLDSAPCLTLSCGHKWHRECLEHQLLHARQDPSRRLIFSGCVCAKCATFCDHPQLGHLTSHSKQRREQVDALIKHHLEPGQRVEDGRRNLAFYLCSICEQPFFGGTVQCAEHNHRPSLPPEERVCDRCALTATATSTTATCTNPTHSPFHVWKCRYCCQPATTVCFGRTHFCQHCHARMSSEDTITPIPCPGSSTCPQPMLPRRRSHRNGREPHCEQLLHCALCLSTSNSTAPVDDLPPMSRNLLFNPSGAQGTSGWIHLSPHQTWVVETSELPYPPHTTNFVSSCSPCVMAQVIDLSTYVRNPAAARFHASARFMARTDCPSRFSMGVAVYDRHFRELAHYTTPVLQAPPDCWDRAQHSLQPDQHARFLLVVMQGQDNAFWAGLYGSKVTDISVRVLLEDLREEDILTSNEVDNTEENSATISVLNSFQQRRIRDHEDHRRRLFRQRRQLRQQGRQRAQRIPEDEQQPQRPLQGETSRTNCTLQ